MKKSIKFISLFLVSIAMILIGKENVFAADNSPRQFTAISYPITDTLGKNPLGLTNNISVKKTTDGKYVYCYDVNDLVPNNVLYTRSAIATNAGIHSIIASGANDKNDSDFFATQAALWIYLLDNGFMKDTEYNYIANIKNAVYGSYANDAIAKDIKNILTTANSAKSTEPALTINIGGKSVKFTLMAGDYISNVIPVTSTSNNYKVTSYNAPNKTGFIMKSNGFVITIPEESVKAGTTTFDIEVTSTESKYNVYKYTASNSAYQDLQAAYPEKVNLSDDITVSITKTISKPDPIIPADPDDPTVIVISKQDITNKGVELPGATLVVRNSRGNVVARWVSGNRAYVLDDLSVGTYTLEEVSAPKGYELSDEKIKFTVKEDNKTKEVVMYNTPVEEPTVIVISKQDITDKEELPGATLVVRDNKGKEIERWVSTDKPHTLDKLEVGTYTLEEIIAPNGYVLSSEKIEFTVKEDGKIKTVVMYNTPEEVKETIVSISKKDITNKEELPGATLIIKNSNGKELYRWVSSNEPYIIKGIEEGTYTLEEITAPEGYKLSSEKITFEVKNNGVVTEVVMFNTPEVPEIIVPPTGSFASNIAYIIGGLVIIIGSVLLFRNAKKEH